MAVTFPPATLMNSAPIPVLIVDDDPTMAAVLKELLRGFEGEWACATKWVATAAAAEAEFKSGHHRVVLLDYLLPDVDGLTLLTRIAEIPEDRRPVVVMLTGVGSEQIAVAAMKLGAKDYIVKSSLTLPALKRAITGALERRRLEERLARQTEELRRKNSQLESELAMAREVQQALLPQQFPVFPPGVAPAASTLQFHRRWIPSHNVAGDFFAVLPLSDTSAGIFVCDVMGHGVRAALVTALLQGLLSEHRASAAEPGEFLGALNRALKAMLERSAQVVFVTAVYAVLDVARGEVALANAGHPPPFCRQRRTGRCVPLAAADGPGTALGLIPESTYDVLRFPLTPGDSLLIYTDGLYEVADRNGDEFGRERLRKLVEADPGLPTPLLLDKLLAAVKAHQPAGHAEGFDDDVCLVAVDFRAGEGS